MRSCCSACFYYVAFEFVTYKAEWVGLDRFSTAKCRAASALAATWADKGKRASCFSTYMASGQDLEALEVTLTREMEDEIAMSQAWLRSFAMRVPRVLV